MSDREFLDSLRLARTLLNDIIACVEKGTLATDSVYDLGAVVNDEILAKVEVIELPPPKGPEGCK